MALHPRGRGRLIEITRGLWLNKNQEEELRPSSEPTCDNMDPWVTEKMMNLGFEWGQIQNSVTSKKYNKLMSKLLILSTKKP